MLMTIERVDAETYSVYVHNTTLGQGVEYHPSSARAHPKAGAPRTRPGAFAPEPAVQMKFLTTIKLTVPASRLTDDGFWYMFFKVQAVASDDHRKEILYDILLP
jgi:hypothetical protein